MQTQLHSDPARVINQSSLSEPAFEEARRFPDCKACSQELDRPIEAAKILAKLPGCSEALLIEDEEQELWVVKFSSNRMHKRIVTNEFISTNLARHLGLSVPEQRIIQVSSEVLESALVEGKPIHTKYHAPGVHIGSKYMRATQRIRSLLGSSTQNISNAWELAGIMALDVWLANTDFRQMLLVETGEADHSLCLYWIDFSHSFDLSTWRLQNWVFRPSWSLSNLVDGSYDDSAFEPWLKRIEEVRLETLRDIWGRIPIEWTHGEEENLQLLKQNVIGRQHEVRSLLNNSLSCQPDTRNAWRPSVVPNRSLPV